MAMVSVFWLVSSLDRLDPKVGSHHLVLCCIYCMNRVNSRNAMTAL